MKYLPSAKKHTAMLTLGAGLLLLPFAASAQTASPSPSATPAEQREEHHDYGWIGLLGLAGLAGLLRRTPHVNVAERTSNTR
ncbi:MAG TPA: WGxxGxxG family protein [Chthoniobacterales bacterium]